MVRTSSLTPKKLLGNFFAIFALGVIFSIYYTVISTYYPLCLYSSPTFYQTVTILVLFHFLFSLMILCFFKTMLTDPGTVPPLWGFYMGDSESKRRRYCLMCHVFKPERCHHCSACNRCVLNMDHHCRNNHLAWVNNCVGFYNRKFFLLLLLYIILCTYFVFVSLFTKSYSILKRLVQTQTYPMYSEGLFIGIFLLNASISTTLTFFFKFHVKLALMNSTTIETMDKKVVNKVNYNKGVRANLEQIFGRNPWIWFFPFNGESGKPIGDGVVWTVPVFVVVDDVPGDEGEKRQSTTYVEESKRASEDGTGRINTAPDSVRSKVEVRPWGFGLESKVSSVRIEEKAFDDLVFSPEN